METVVAGINGFTVAFDKSIPGMIPVSLKIKGMQLALIMCGIALFSPGSSGPMPRGNWKHHTVPD